ncbi:hypothetical protein R5R35_000030 [Gryllus longicercus]|uniref:Uncharacterized protein n=1 Tax=Gryllus longicercus TaxID=2509291 RepID=A0AAN9Z7R9_9ORTH
MYGRLSSNRWLAQAERVCVCVCLQWEGPEFRAAPPGARAGEAARLLPAVSVRPRLPPGHTHRQQHRRRHRLQLQGGGGAHPALHRQQVVPVGAGDGAAQAVQRGPRVPGAAGAGAAGAPAPAAPAALPAGHASGGALAAARVGAGGEGGGRRAAPCAGAQPPTPPAARRAHAAPVRGAARGTPLKAAPHVRYSTSSEQAHGQFRVEWMSCWLFAE